MSLVICTWPSCGHTAKGQCRPLQEGGNLAAADRLTALEAEVARLRVLVEQAEYQLGGENNAVRRRWADWRETARAALAQGEQP